MGFLEVLNHLALDADPAQAGFQAKWLYVALCVAGPVSFGVGVGLLLSAVERVFGIKLSSKGGH